MKNSLKKALKFLAVIIPIAALGGYFTGMYTYESYSEDVRQQLMASVGGSFAIYTVTVIIQSVIYAAVTGFLGIIIADRMQLLNHPLISKKPLIRSSIITLGCGLLFGLDYPLFGSLIPQVADSYKGGISVNYFFSSLLYGGVIEEVLLRLFFMSLIALILWKLFARKHKSDDIPTWVFVSANIIAALAFAAGHLPATYLLFGAFTPLILFRCFLLNGGLGLVFGRLYRKYGIQYAMLGHLGTHLVSKLLLIIFLH